MEIELSKLTIAVEEETVQGTVLAPATALPAILFVHGWGGSQEQDLARAREAAGLGCVCMTIDLRGHDLESSRSRNVTREQNLQDLLQAYDWLAQQPNVSPDAIAVVGISYGGYLAAILSSLRPVRWLALRSPALYKDAGWKLPKRQLNADPDLFAYRRRRIDAEDNFALKACSQFRGDALVVESQHDDIVPHTVIENYIAALNGVNSLTSRTLTGADHALSEKWMRKSYTGVLINWLTEMIAGARSNAALEQLEQNRLSGDAT